MHEETIFILKEKFKALEQSIDINEHTFCKATLEYSSYIGNTQYLSDFVKQMGLEHDIHREIFSRLFLYSTLKTGFKNQYLKREGIGKPLFWSKEIETEDYQTTVATVLSVARRAKTIFESSEIHEKRAFINFLVQNPVVSGRELTFSLKKPFDSVLVLADAQTKTTSISADRSSWLGD